MLALSRFRTPPAAKKAGDFNNFERIYQNTA
jgi:hypothetical protein